STFFVSNASEASHALVSAQADGIVTLIKGCQSIEKKVAKATGMKDGLLAKTKVPSYETNVPEEVRETNAYKIDDYEAEISVLQEAIEKFLTLKGSN
ncbi:hypothetical protein GGI19_003628, partial [Coemansia pectinata]